MPDNVSPSPRHPSRGWDCYLVVHVAIAFGLDFHVVGICAPGRVRLRTRHARVRQRHLAGYGVGDRCFGGGCCERDRRGERVDLGRELRDDGGFVLR